MKMSKLEKVIVNITTRLRNIKTVEQLFSHIDLGKVKKVLEIGCGVGALSSYLADKYKWKVTEIDLDPEQIEKAKKYHRENKYLKFLEADATKLSFENSEFDMILSFDALHHIPNWDKALNEINRVLRSQGFYILHDLTIPRFSFFKKWSIVADDIINHLKRNNFKIIYEKKPKINIIGRRFSIISQKSSTNYLQ